jgi:hypothetical protein
MTGRERGIFRENLIMKMSFGGFASCSTSGFRAESARFFVPYGPANLTAATSLPCVFFALPAFLINRFSVLYGTENLLLLLRKLRGLLVCLRHAQLHFQRNVPTSARQRASSL